MSTQYIPKPRSRSKPTLRTSTDAAMYRRQQPPHQRTGVHQQTQEERRTKLGADGANLEGATCTLATERTSPSNHRPHQLRTSSPTGLPLNTMLSQSFSLSGTLKLPPPTLQSFYRYFSSPHNISFQLKSTQSPHNTHSHRGYSTHHNTLCLAHTTHMHKKTPRHKQPYKNHHTTPPTLPKNKKSYIPLGMQTLPPITALQTSPRRCSTAPPSYSLAETSPNHFNHRRQTLSHTTQPHPLWLAQKPANCSANRNKKHIWHQPTLYKTSRRPHSLIR